MLRILVTLVAVPTMLTIGSALVLRTRITSEMTVGTFPLLPLLVMELAGAQNIARLCSIAIRLAVLLTLGAVALSPAIALSRTWLSSSAMKVAPFQEVAVEATRLWHERTPLPLTYVTGSDWYDNTVAFYSPDRPHAFVHFEYYLSGWVSPEANARHGLLAICVKTDRDCLAAATRFATPGTTQAQLSLAHRFWGHVANPVDFVVAVIPPRT